MRKAVIFDSFADNCTYFNSNTEINGSYGCDHSNQREIKDEKGKKQGCCHCFCCPLGIEAEQQDLTDKQNSDAVSDEIDWDNLCEDGEVEEGEYLLINVGEDATEEEKQAIYNYELFMHRYDKKWLDEHGIINALV